MTLKTKLDARIRGWFPQEPKTGKFLAANNASIDNSIFGVPLMISPEWKFRATTYTARMTFICFFIFSISFFSFMSSFFGRHPVTGLQIAAVVTVGLAVGAILSTITTKKQLGQLLSKYQVNIKERYLIAGIVIVLVTFCFVPFVGLFLDIPLLGPVLEISCYTGAVSAVVSRIVLMALFEREQNMRIMQDNFGLNLVLIPKPPDRSS